MARVALAWTQSRWLPAGSRPGDGEASLEVLGASMRGVLEGVFARHPNMRDYLLDELGDVHHHVAIFVDGNSVSGKQQLDRGPAWHSEAHLMQSLWEG